MSKNRRGRPLLPDPPPERVANPPKARLSSRDLSERDLEARRYAERMAKRRQREAARRNRDNPQNLPRGVDGLKLLQEARELREQLAEFNAERRKLAADLAVVQGLRAAEQRESAELRRKLAEIEKRIAN